MQTSHLTQIDPTTWSLTNEGRTFHLAMHTLPKTTNMAPVLDAIEHAFASHRTQQSFTVTAQNRTYRVQQEPLPFGQSLLKFFNRSYTTTFSVKTQVESVNPYGFYRIDKRVWSMPKEDGAELRFTMPKLEREHDMIALLKSVNRLFCSEEVSNIQKGIVLTVETEDSTKTYRIRQQKAPSFVTRLFRKVIHTITPYRCSEIRNKKIVFLDVRKMGFWQRIVSKVSRATSFFYTIGNEALQFPRIRFTGSSINAVSFKDPFTTLSAWCFQNVEPATSFIMHKEHKGAYRLVLSRGGELRLEKIGKTRTDEQVREDRRTVRAYRAFLEREYGKRFVKQIKTLCGVDLKNIGPLLPDHVFKCNIAVNSIEMTHAEAFWRKLKRARDVLPQLHDRLYEPITDENKHTLKELFRIFPTRELRGLCRVAQGDQQGIPTVNRLSTFLTSLLGHETVDSIRELPEQVSSQVLSMLMPTPGELDRAFTGRKMRHIEIGGSHAMENPNNENPCRLIFELLHVYRDLAKTNDWKNFFELLAHVVVKKALYRPPHGNDAERMRVGVILPAPTSQEGHKRWYYNEALLDDSHGHVSYTFFPVAQGATNHPFIRGFRSTSSDRSTMNSLDSIAADLNPTSPGSLKPELAPKHQGHYLEERTIPLWAAYHKAPKNPTLDLSFEKEKMAAKLFIEYARERIANHEKVVPIIETMVKSEDIALLNQTLEEWGQQLEEFPEHKTPQDVVLVGQSLGASLAQFGVYHTAVRAERVPLPGHTCTCYAYNAPAISTRQDAAFMEFGKRHAEIFSSLNIRWDIRYLFEHRDAVPIAGGSHLGITGYTEKDKRWLTFSAKVFRPLSTAIALCITARRCHGRRISRATERRDYSIRSVSPQELQEHDRGWWMSAKVARIFGYTIARSPNLIEGLRRTVGVITYIPLRIIEAIRGHGIGRRSSDGVLFIPYERT